MKNLTKGNIYKTFFMFGFPLVLSGVLAQAYGVFDTMIAGKFLGDRGLAAMGATAPLITFVSSVFWGFGNGLSIYLARLFGEKKYEKIKKIAYTEIFMIALFCLVIGIGMTIFYKPIFSFLKISSEIYEDAFAYFSVYMIGLFFILLNENFVFILNSFGISMFPFYISVLSALLNIGGNILAVSALKMGIAGLAYASVLSATAVNIAYFIKLKNCFREMGTANIKIRISFKSLRDSVPYFLPNTFQQMALYLAGVLISPLVNGIGASASASYSVVSRIYDINTSVYQNSAKTLSNFTAQCVGAGKNDKIKKGVLVGLIQGIVFATPFILSCVFFYQPICNFFFKSNASAEAKEYAYLFSKVYLPFIYLQLICNLFHALYRGVKRMGFLLFCTAFSAVVRYGFSVILIKQMGIKGFYLGWVISWAAEAAVAALYFFLGHWQPKNERAHVVSATNVSLSENSSSKEAISKADVR